MSDIQRMLKTMCDSKKEIYKIMIDNSFLMKKLIGNYISRIYMIGNFLNSIYNHLQSVFQNLPPIIVTQLHFLEDYYKVLSNLRTNKVFTFHPIKDVLETLIYFVHYNMAESPEKRELILLIGNLKIYIDSEFPNLQSICMDLISYETQINHYLKIIHRVLPHFEYQVIKTFNNIIYKYDQLKNMQNIVRLIYFAYGKSQSIEQIKSIITYDEHECIDINFVNQPPNDLRNGLLILESSLNPFKPFNF